MTARRHPEKNWHHNRRGTVAQSRMPQGTPPKKFQGKKWNGKYRQSHPCPKGKGSDLQNPKGEWPQTNVEQNPHTAAGEPENKPTQVTPPPYARKANPDTPAADNRAQERETAQEQPKEKAGTHTKAQNAAQQSGRNGDHDHQIGGEQPQERSQECERNEIMQWRPA
ncbi:hypothetical protein NDU88_005447 [Pleurodeles waltl]|uniref:Uncharacterized protein n=1 Tax=Pleurodeles waltl TaxID=8319 RepID=A0AAV7NQB1_PLEWA|nr:hypothetical protein NDU88_005447 [Pleurodeles waltl]